MTCPGDENKRAKNCNIQFLVITAQKSYWNNRPVDFASKQRFEVSKRTVSLSIIFNVFTTILFKLDRFKMQPLSHVIGWSRDFRYRIDDPHFVVWTGGYVICWLRSDRIKGRKQIYFILIWPKSKSFLWKLTQLIWWANVTSPDSCVTYR